MMRPALEERAQPAGYRMIKEFTLSNFRGFRSAALRDLRRIILVVGENGSGKTALMESVLLSGWGSPQGAWIVRGFRSLMPLQPLVWDRSLFESFWKDIFFQFDPANVIETKIVDSDLGAYGLRVSLDRRGEATPINYPPVPPLLFERSGPGSSTSTVKAVLNDKHGMETQGYADVIPPMFFFTAGARFDHRLACFWFSELKKKGKEKDFLRYFTQEYDEIREVEILLDAGAPALFATIKGIKNRVPISLYSDGASRFATILLAIANYEKGVILVDEVENGFYFDRFTRIWSILLKSAERNNVQLFLSTHSKEWLDAAGPLIVENESSFSLLRTRREMARDEQYAECSVYQTTSESIAAGSRLGVDFRKTRQQKKK
jgi:hypothetical protein